MNDVVNDRVVLPQFGLAWSIFAEGLKYPDKELRQAIRKGEFSEELHLALQDCDTKFLDQVDWDALKQTGETDEDLQVEYNRLFEQSAGGVCSLYTSHLFGAQMKTMEEIVRFYNHFGVKLSEDSTETPDHLKVELEFLHCLAYGEADHRARGEDPAAYARARRDFIVRHVGRAVSLIMSRIAKHPKTFYRELFRLLESCLQAEQSKLETEYGVGKSQTVSLIYRA